MQRIRVRQVAEGNPLVDQDYVAAHDITQVLVKHLGRKNLQVEPLLNDDEAVLNFCLNVLKILKEPKEVRESAIYLPSSRNSVPSYGKRCLFCGNNPDRKGSDECNCFQMEFWDYFDFYSSCDDPEITIPYLRKTILLDGQYKELDVFIPADDRGNIICMCNSSRSFSLFPSVSMDSVSKMERKFFLMKVLDVEVDFEYDLLAKPVAIIDPCSNSDEEMARNPLVQLEGPKRMEIVGQEKREVLMKFICNSKYIGKVCYDLK